MKHSYVVVAAAAVFASGACNAENGGSGGSSPSEPVQAVAPPQGGDWTKVVSKTPQGGFVMGNPNASVKLVEFASMTCPHCAEFSEHGAEELVNEYVKSGRVSFELRNFVRDPLDITLSLIARCGGPQRFFPLTDAMFQSQRQFFERVQAAAAPEQQALTQLPPAQQFAGYARLAGLQQWAAQRGVPSARQQQCLANQGEIDQLVQMNGDTTSQYPDFKGTPSFVINGEMVENAATWELLEPKLREALGERG
jgi:protein-disulfide isomerase